MIRRTRLALLVGLMLAVSPVLFVTSVWADTFRLRQIPLEATVLDETTGEAVSIEAELLVVVRCGAQPSVNAVVVRHAPRARAGVGMYSWEPITPPLAMTASTLFSRPP